MSAFRARDPSRYRTANALVIAFRLAIASSIHHGHPANPQLTSPGGRLRRTFPHEATNRYADLLDESTRALDTPLSPPPLDDEPGPATGRSGAYPDRTHTCWLGTACRTQHSKEPMRSRPTASGRSG